MQKRGFKVAVNLKEGRVITGSKSIAAATVGAVLHVARFDAEAAAHETH